MITNITNINPGTETIIYSIYKWEISKKLIRSQTDYFFNDLINIKNFNSNLLKIDKKLYKILIFITLDISKTKISVIMKIFTV